MEEEEEEEEDAALVDGSLPLLAPECCSQKQEAVSHMRDGAKGCVAHKNASIEHGATACKQNALKSQTNVRCETDKIPKSCDQSATDIETS